MRLQEAARVSKWELLRVGIFSDVAAQWMPGILEAFYEAYPDVVVKLEQESCYLNGELDVKEHSWIAASSLDSRPLAWRAFPSMRTPTIWWWKRRAIWPASKRSLYGMWWESTSYSNQ